MLMLLSNCLCTADSGSRFRNPLPLRSRCRVVSCTLEFNPLDLCPLGIIRSFEVEVAEVEGVLALLSADIASIISRVIEVAYIGSLPLPLPLPLSLSNAVFGSTFSFTNPDLQ
jgi:hypothetical protein